MEKVGLFKASIGMESIAGCTNPNWETIGWLESPIAMSKPIGGISAV